MDMDPRNIPTAFLNIIPLSQLPEKSTFDMLFGGKTIEEVATGYGIDYATVPVGLGWEDEDDDWGWMDMGDPDALDKAKYQAENPNAIMTPWGPALAPEAVDAIIDDNPGVQSLLGLTPEEIDEIAADADAIIDAGGDNFDTIIEQGNAAAMAENLDPNEVLTGMVDEMANTPSPSDTLFGGQPIDEFAADYGINYAAAEEGFGEEEEGPWWQNWLENSSFSPLNWGVETAEAYDPAWAQYGADLAEEAKAKEEAAQADAAFLETLLGLSNDEIIAAIQGELDSGDLFPASVEALGQKHADKYGLVQTVLGLAGQDPLDMTKNAAGTVPDVIDLDSLPGGGPAAIVNNELHKIYFETTGALPDDRAKEAETLFWLYKHEAVGSQFDNKDKVGSLYKPFLTDYIKNRYKYTSGADFDAAIQRLSEQLTKQDAEGPDGTGYGRFADAYFGGDDKDDITRRKILIKLYNSGSSYGPSEMHAGIEQGMAGWELKGKTPAEIFALYTMPKYIPGSEGQDPYYHPADAGTSGLGATQPYEYDTIGLRDPALSFTPELYSPGIQRFGMPGETMATRHPRFRTDPFQPLPTVYDRTGMRDPAESLTQELLGGVADRFGTSSNQWPYDPMRVPGINAAALPISSPDPAEIAAYLAAQEAKMPWNTMPVSKEMYSEAMTQLASAKPGTSYKAYESKKAVKGIPQEQLESMPEPYNDEQRGRRDKGLPYITGRWTGGSKAKWMAKSEAEQAAIRGGDLWVSGTTFVPTKAWGKE